MIKKDEYTYVPRFGTVKICKTFKTEDEARKAGFTEPTYSRSTEFGVLGKNEYPRMFFAAFPKGEK